MFNLEFTEPEWITKLSDSGKFRECLFALSGASSSAVTWHVLGGGEAVSIKAPNQQAPLAVNRVHGEVSLHKSTVRL